MSPATDLNELGFYVLAGAPKTPADLIDEVADGEALGLGAAFISERYNIKEAATLSGAAGAVSHAHRHRDRRDEPQHPPSRSSPASYATTMHRLTRRPVHARARARHRRRCSDAFGIPRSRPRRWRTSSALLRRLWHGEVVFGHDGPAGQFPILHLDATFDEDIPLGLVAFGPEHARARGPGVRHGGAAHVLHRRDDERCRRDGARRGRAGRARPGVRAHLVVLRDGPRHDLPTTCG